MKAKKAIRSCPAAIALAFGLMCPSNLYALTEVYNTEGTFNWVCPAGVTSITVECWAGGGAGGSASKMAGATAHVGGGGGGGGAYAKSTAVAVTPGLTYTVTIPAPATNSLPVVDGLTVDGADVSFTGDSVTVTAAGGKGGVSVLQTSNVVMAGAGGLGGADVDCVGDVSFSGGFGVKRPTNAAGAGGGGAGSTEDGVDAVEGVNNGGLGGVEGGGKGGDGKTGQGNGSAGSNAGGGGGGGRSQTAGVAYAGGTGGLGQIVLSDGVAFNSVKDDNTDDLNLTSSWTAGIPGASDVAVWDSTVTAANTTVLGADAAWGGISIKDAGGLVTIDAGNTLTLGLADTDIDMSSADLVDLTLNCPLALSAVNVWDVNTGRTLTVAGGVSGTGPVTMQGGGTVLLNSAGNYTGTTTIGAGTTVQVGATNVIPENVTVNGTLDINTFSQNIRAFNGSGIVDTVAGGTPLLKVGFFGQGGNFTGILQNTTGTLNFEKQGSGTLTLSGANTFSGTLAVTVPSTSGTVVLNNLNAVQNVTGITLKDSASLSLPLDTMTITAPITLDAGGKIVSPSPADGLTESVSLNGGIDGTGDLEIRTNVAINTRPRVVLGGAGTYDGNTTINNSDKGNLAVQAGVAGALPATTALTINNVGSGSGRYAEYDLNGFDQTLVGLTSTGAMSNRAVISNSSATAVTLTINNSADFTYAGVLGASGYPLGGFEPFFGGSNFGLTKGDAGILTLSGVLACTDDTTVTDGSLVLSDTSTATFYPTTNGTSNKLSGGASLGTGTVTLDGALSLDLGSTDTTSGNSWLLVDSTNLASPAGYGGTFTITSSLGAFTNSGGDWTLTDSGNLWTFKQSTGELSVETAPAGGYAAWAATNAPTGTPSDDYDIDSVSNGVEYVVGRTGTTNDAAKLPQLSTSGGNMVFTFVRDQQSIDGTTAVTIEVGTTLATWPDSYPVPADAVAADPGVTVVKDSPEVGKDTITLSVAQSPDQKKFARLKVIP